MTATARVAPRPGVRPGVRRRPERFSAPALRLVPRLADRSKPALRWGVASLAVLGVILAVQLVLSIVVSQGAYEIQALEAQQIQTSRSETALAAEVGALGSPQHLASAATAQGMVPGRAFVMLDPATGQVIGEPSPVGGPVNPALVGNQALTPTAPNAANPNVPAGGVSSPTGVGAGVPSAVEIAAPTTR